MLWKFKIELSVYFHIQDFPLSSDIFSFVPEQMMEQMIDLESRSIAENRRNFERNLGFQEVSSKLYSQNAPVQNLYKNL